MPEVLHSSHVLLISCYELGQQPIGLASPLGFLRRAGINAKGVDVSVQQLTSHDLEQVGFVGISVPMHTALRIGTRIAEQIHSKNFDVKICFYGLYAWLNAEHLFSDHNADFVIGGEFELPLVHLIQACSSSKEGQSVPGVWSRGNRSEPFIEKIPLHRPFRESLPPLDRYAKLAIDGQERLVGHVEASRGCKHLCLHCPIPPVYGGRFFIVPKEHVLADTRYLVQAGARHITFADPDFLNGPKHALEIVRLLHKEFPHLTYDFTAKVEHLLKDQTMLDELASLGCLFVVSAVETLNDAVLLHLNKGHRSEDVVEALGMVRASGMVFRPSFVPFTPWETSDSYMELLRFIEEEDLIDAVDPIQLGIRLLVPPRSALLEHEAIQRHLVGLNAERFTYEWNHPDPRMDKLQAEVMQIVEEDADHKEEAAQTFQRIAETALRTLESGGNAFTFEVLPKRNRLPRLTEPWFC